MRNTILAATAVVGLAASTLFAPGNARAENYPWCAVLSVGDAAYNCGFTTLEQCRATVSGVAASARSTGSPMSLSGRRQSACVVRVDVRRAGSGAGSRPVILRCAPKARLEG